ncbi:hypothetical protein ELY20_13615, partial [Legionella qingyii]
CMMVNPYNVENILDHISSCTSKKIILFLKIMVTFCDHLSGFMPERSTRNYSSLAPVVYLQSSGAITPLQALIQK